MKTLGALAVALVACGPLPRTAWDDVPRPIIVGHRGTGNVAAPENTFAAFDVAVSAGAAIETDIQRTQDGSLVLMHDDSVNRTSGTTLGNVAGLTLAQIDALDVSRPFHPEVFSPQRVPKFEEFLKRYGPTSLLAPEIKPATGPTGAEAALLIHKLSLEERALGYSFSQDQLLAVRRMEPHIPLVLISSTTVSPTTAKLLGLWGVSIADNAITPQYVADMHAAGKKVLAWTLRSLTQAERLVSWGVDGVITDDPEYFVKLLNRRTPTGSTVVSVPERFLGSGWITSAPGWTPATVDGFATFTGVGTVTDGAYSHIQIAGIRTADEPARQTITTTLRVQVGPTSGNTSRFVGLKFAWARDDDTSIYGGPGTRGYDVLIRLSGAVELVRITEGTYEIIANANWPAIRVGEAIPIRVEVDASTIKVTRTDTSDTISATDTTFPRGGFVGAFGDGTVPAVGETTVSY